MNNITGKQWLLIASAVLSALVAASAQLTDIFGASAAKAIISFASLANTILTSIVATIIGQGSLVKDVAAMPGVEGINVNAKANKTLAAIAVDPQFEKVSATPEAVNEVVNTAATKG